MKAKTLLVWILVFGGLGAAESNAGAWTQKKDGGYYKLGLSTLSSEEFIDGEGNAESIPRKSHFTVFFYGEYGIEDNLTAIAYLPFFSRVSVEEGFNEDTGLPTSAGDNTTIGDPEFGLRYRLFKQGPAVLSAGIKLGLPVGDYAADNIFSTGDGEFNQLINLQFGYSFYPLYATAELGFNNRSEGYSDEVRAMLEVGLSIGGPLTIIGRTRVLHPLKNGAGVGDAMAGVTVSDQRFLAFNINLVLDITDTFGVDAGYETATNIRNLLKAPTLFFGAYLKM